MIPHLRTDRDRGAHPRRGPGHASSSPGCVHGRLAELDTARMQLPFFKVAAAGSGTLFSVFVTS